MLAARQVDMLRLRALPLLLLTALLGVGAPPAHAETTAAAALLQRVPSSPESGSATYDRALFRHWTDADGDCQNTRAEVLLAETRTAATTSASGCTVAAGSWYSPYDGRTWTRAADVDVDHVVALKEAWESGARSWTSTDRTRFANDLSYGRTLLAVTDEVNAAKADRDPAQWLPPRAAARCTYAVNWVLIKYRWRLAVDATERAALSSLLSSTCGARTVVVPARAR